MPTLTTNEYSLITNVMSLCCAAMLAGALFFFFSRSQVAHKYRPALLISALVPTIACYHYFRIYESFSRAYNLTNGAYVASGMPFNDAYRYADWLLTVPLLVIELVAVLALSSDVSRRLIAKLSTAAALMIALGYPGEVSHEPTTRWIFWALSMMPWLFIMFTLFTEFTQAYSRQPEEVKSLVGAARGLLLVTWAFYPIAFLSPMLGLSGGVAECGLQVGYTVADIVAKVGLGIYIYLIALAKSSADGYAGSEVLSPVKSMVS
ncbi:bacteriorhodopsin-like [soil metagenome]